MVCACTHLTAFSALFVPNGDSCEVGIRAPFFFAWIYLILSRSHYLFCLGLEMGHPSHHCRFFTCLYRAPWFWYYHFGTFTYPSTYDEPS